MEITLIMNTNNNQMITYFFLLFLGALAAGFVAGVDFESFITLGAALVGLLEIFFVMALKLSD